MVIQVGSGLGHATGVTRLADATAPAGEGDPVVVRTVVTPGAGKAVGKDAAFQLFAQCNLNVSGRGVVVVLVFRDHHSKRKTPFVLHV